MIQENIPVSHKNLDIQECLGILAARCPIMLRSRRKYNQEYKVQAVKLAKEIGGAKATKD